MGATAVGLMLDHVCRNRTPGSGKLEQHGIASVSGRKQGHTTLNPLDGAVSQLGSQVARTDRRSVDTSHATSFWPWPAGAALCGFDMNTEPLPRTQDR